MEETPRNDESFNPYAPPESELWAPRTAAEANIEEGPWRAGSFLVMSKDGWLPDRCIRCNREPAVRLDRNLLWHRPLIYLALLLHVLLYLVIANFAVKTARIRVPLCAEHNRARWTRIAVGALCLLFGVATILIAIDDPASMGYVLFFPPLAIVAGLLILLIGRHPIPPKKIDDEHVWLKKVSPEILAELPDAPYELRLR